jgi:tetratricopeptide (TPR) repeat protein
MDRSPLAGRIRPARLIRTGFVPGDLSGDIRIMRRLPVFFAVLASAAPAFAGEKVLYQPVPDWVKPAPAVDTAKLGEDAPVLLVLDNQQKLEGGQVWTYMETATRAANAQLLGPIGQVQLPWHPTQGDLIVHTLEIIRGKERIDLIKGGDPFTILRREQQMDQRMLDGMLTATLPVAGLSVGDVLHMAVSVTRRDPTLKGDLHTSAPLIADPVRVQFARARLVWPETSDVRWRAYSDGVAQAPVNAGGWRELVVTMPLAKQPEVPSDAPLRFQHLPILEATTFADWAAVSKVMAPLYATDGLIAPDSPLAAEVATIAKASADPTTRAAMALRLVQDKVRYLLLGMDTGNYVPQTPQQTWSTRYGDCKAKTLMLLAMLRALGIEAEPVLASIKAGGLVESRLPGVAAFDHVLVRATIGDETLWLDGTMLGTRQPDLRDPPPFATVLPVRAEGAALVDIPGKASARPGLAVTIDLDERAGLNLPAPFTATLVIRGGLAEQIKGGLAQASKEDTDGFVQAMFKDYLDAPAVATRAISFDAEAATATITASGIAYPNWTTENRRLRTPVDRTIKGMEFKPDRARTAWSAIPVKTGDPSHVSVTTRIRLPAGGAGFTIDGDGALAGRFAGTDVSRTVTQADGVVTIVEAARTDGSEIAATAIPAERQRLAQAQARLPRLAAPADYPAPWRIASEGLRTKAFAPILALYAKRIADAPEERDRLTDRAWFLERIRDRRGAIADLDKAIAMAPDADTYLRRAALHYRLGDSAKALADAEAALKLEPGSKEAVSTLADLKSQAGDGPGALALVQERIDQGGKEVSDFLSSKAEFQARTGASAEALTTIDDAIAEKPGDPGLLNSRCWIKGLSNTALDTALKDCTRAIELSESNSAALDSRALVYFRMGRMEDALADLQAALDGEPDIAGSLFLRGVIRRKQGDAPASEADLAAARFIDPQIDRTYARFGIKP